MGRWRWEKGGWGWPEMMTQMAKLMGSMRITHLPNFEVLVVMELEIGNRQKKVMIISSFLDPYVYENSDNTARDKVITLHGTR